MTSTAEPVAHARAGRSAASRPTRARAQRHHRRGWVFVGPFAVVFALTFLAPLGYALGLSLFRDQAFFGGTVFVGLGNYAEAIADAKFWEAFGRVSLFLAVQVPVMLLLALVAAFAIDSARLHAAGFFRIVIFLPYAVPGVVAVLMWGFIYGDNFGLAADLNHLLGTDAVQPLSKDWILTAIGNIVTWEFVGYNMLIFFSALKVVPGELYEAAELDHASGWQTIWHIKLPALRPAILVATIFSIIGSFQTFTEPDVLKPISPDTIGTAFTPNMYAYNLSFNGQEYNYSATIAIVMGVLTMIIAYVVQRLAARNQGA